MFEIGTSASGARSACRTVRPSPHAAVLPEDELGSPGCCNDMARLAGRPCARKCDGKRSTKNTAAKGLLDGDGVATQRIVATSMFTHAHLTSGQRSAAKPTSRKGSRNAVQANTAKWISKCCTDMTSSKIAFSVRCTSLFGPKSRVQKSRPAYRSRNAKRALAEGTHKN